MPKLWERDWKFKLVSKMRMEGQNPSKTKKEAWMFDWFMVFFGIAFFVFVSSMSYENPSTLEDAYLRIDQEQAKTELCEDVASYMDDYLEAAGYFPLGYSVEWIGYYKYAEDYEFEDWQSWGLSGYYSYSANLSTGEMANGRVQCYWGDGETPTIVNLNIETATTENPIVEYSDEAVSGLLWRLYAKSRSLSHPIKTAVRSPLAAYF